MSFVNPKLYALTDRGRVQRGQDIEIEVDELSDRRIGLVMGRSQSYVPEIMMEGYFNCTCEDFLLNHQFCKHLVALFLTFPKDKQPELIAGMLARRMKQ